MLRHNLQRSKVPQKPAVSQQRPNSKFVSDCQNAESKCRAMKGAGAGHLIVADHVYNTAHDCKLVEDLLLHTIAVKTQITDKDCKDNLENCIIPMINWQLERCREAHRRSKEEHQAILQEGMKAEKEIVVSQITAAPIHAPVAEAGSSTQTTAHHPDTASTLEASDAIDPQAATTLETKKIRVERLQSIWEQRIVATQEAQREVKEAFSKEEKAMREKEEAKAQCFAALEEWEKAAGEEPTSKKRKTQP
ncbi:MAG: hypothetical protein Q9218_006152 [Villophora microphyllina]